MLVAFSELGVDDLLTAIVMGVQNGMCPCLGDIIHNLYPHQLCSYTFVNILTVVKFFR